MVERTWRHLSVMQYRLELRCATPRCQCQEHGVKVVRVPWAEPGSRFTLHFEAFAEAVIAACRSLPQAEIVHDRFHVAKPLKEAVDQTRREESAQLAAEGDDTLKHTRYLWLQGQNPDDQQERFEKLLETNLRTAKAWADKEQMVEFWHQPDADTGHAFF
jgi:transposase